MGTSKRSDQVAVATLFIAVCGFASLMNAGVVSSNDGSHFALVRALADDHTTIIDRHFDYTANVDVSRRLGHYYSDRPPGTAFGAVVPYFLGRILNIGGEFAATSFSSIAAGLACVFVFFLLQNLTFSRAAAFSTALTLGCATLLRTYGSTLFSHAAAAACVAGVAWLLVGRERVDRSRFAAAAAIAGYGASVDYTTVIPTGLLLLLSLAERFYQHRGAERSLRDFTLTVVVTCCAGLLAMVPLFVYNTISFGGPMTLAYDFQVHFSMMHSFSGIYSGNMLVGLFEILLHPRSGLFFWSPILLLLFVAWPMLVKLIRTRRWTLAQLILPALAFLLLTSTYYEVGAGASRDGRYLVPILPLLVLPLAVVFESIFRDRNVILAMSAGGLLLISVLLGVFKQLAIWVRDGSQWLEVICDGHLNVTDFLRWSFPGWVPWIASVVISAGLAGLWLRAHRAESTRTSV